MIGKRWSDSRSTFGGSMRRADWTTITPGSCTRCSLTCGRGLRAPSVRIGSSRAVLEVCKAAGLGGSQAGIRFDGTVRRSGDPGYGDTCTFGDSWIASRCWCRVVCGDS